jgi:hypothetical protein
MMYSHTQFPVSECTHPTGKDRIGIGTREAIEISVYTVRYFGAAESESKSNFP